MMYTKNLSSSIKLNKQRTSVRCACDVRKKYESQVSSRVKENVNQLLLIGTTDIRMMYEFLKDADVFHKDKFEELKQKYQSNIKDIVPVKFTQLNMKENEDNTNENIFLDSDK